MTEQELQAIRERVELDYVFTKAGQVVADPADDLRALLAEVERLRADLADKCKACPGVALMVSHGIGITSSKQLDGDKPTYTTGVKK